MTVSRLLAQMPGYFRAPPSPRAHLREHVPPLFTIQLGKAGSIPRIRYRQMQCTEPGRRSPRSAEHVYAALFGGPSKELLLGADVRVAAIRLLRIPRLLPESSRTPGHKTMFHCLQNLRRQLRFLCGVLDVSKPRLLTVQGPRSAAARASRRECQCRSASGRPSAVTPAAQAALVVPGRTWDNTCERHEAQPPPQASETGALRDGRCWRFKTMRDGGREVFVHRPGEIRSWKQVECLQEECRLNCMHKRRLWRPDLWSCQSLYVRQIDEAPNEPPHEPLHNSAADQSPNQATLHRRKFLRHLPAREPPVHRALLQRNLPLAHAQADGARLLQRVGAHRRLVRRRRGVRHKPDAEQLPGRLRRVPAHIAVRCAARISSCVRI